MATEEVNSQDLQEREAEGSNTATRKDSGSEADFQSILERGINFGKGGQKKQESGKVKTKAKKKKYITGAHGSGSAMQKAKYREQRANRHKGK